MAKMTILSGKKTFYKSVMDRRTNGPTDGRTDGWTDTASYRDARTHLKTFQHIFDLWWLARRRKEVF